MKSFVIALPLLLSAPVFGAPAEARAFLARPVPPRLRLGGAHSASICKRIHANGCYTLVIHGGYMVVTWCLCAGVCTCERIREKGAGCRPLHGAPGAQTH